LDDLARSFVGGTERSQMQAILEPISTATKEDFEFSLIKVINYIKRQSSRSPPRLLGKTGELITILEKIKNSRQSIEERLEFTRRLIGLLVWKYEYMKVNR
jgi:hypothetical protein